MRKKQPLSKLKKYEVLKVVVLYKSKIEIKSIIYWQNSNNIA